MTKAIKFAKLDFLTITPYLTWKVSLLFLVVSAFVGYGTGETSVIVGMCMIYGVIFGSYPFAIGEKSALDTLYATLPVNKKQLVAGRYLFFVLLNLAALVFACLLSFVLLTVLGKEFDLLTNIISALVCFVLFSVVGAIQMPIYFRFGYTKAKFLTYIPLMAFPAATIIVSSLVGENNPIPVLINAITWIEANSVMTLLLAIVLWAGALLLSGVLSYRMYRKREF